MTVTVGFAKLCRNPWLFSKTIPGRFVSPHRIVGKYAACIVANLRKFRPTCLCPKALCQR